MTDTTKLTNFSQNKHIRRTKKFLSRSQLSTWRENTHGIIVQCSGTYDLIHGGHLTHLREAKSYGDVLIVSVNSDESVARYKPGRPYMDLFHRVLILCSLDMIDAVTVFEEDDPSEVISIIKPTIYVKGHDAVIDSNTPEMKILFATSALRLTSKENHVEFHSSEIVRKLNEDTSAS